MRFLLPKQHTKHTLSPCRNCKEHRQHDILHAEDVARDEYYHLKTSYRMVKCRGCLTIGFRIDLHDYEQGYPDEQGGWIHDTKTTVFPKCIIGHHSPPGDWHIPSVVRKIYLQSLSAIQEEARILAGLGLRGVIEAVCHDLEIGGSNLEKKISNLASQGMIAKKDAERLHAIRFLGNDAAHDIKQPELSQLLIALRIVKHLLNTVYILPREIAGELDTIVTDYKEFTSLLWDSLHYCKEGEEVLLARIINHHLRRIKDALPGFETELIKDVKAGLFIGLEIGQIVHVGNPSKPVQLFRVKAEEVHDDDSIHIRAACK